MRVPRDTKKPETEILFQRGCKIPLICDCTSYPLKFTGRYGRKTFGWLDPYGEAGYPFCLFAMCCFAFSQHSDGTYDLLCKWGSVLWKSDQTHGLFATGCAANLGPWALRNIWVLHGIALLLFLLSVHGCWRFGKRTAHIEAKQNRPGTALCCCFARTRWQVMPLLHRQPWKFGSFSVAFFRNCRIRPAFARVALHAFAHFSTTYLPLSSLITIVLSYHNIKFKHHLSLSNNNDILLH